MSTPHDIPQVILEWSPDLVIAYDVATKQTRRGSTIAEALSGSPVRSALVTISRRVAFVRALRVPDAPKEVVRSALVLSLGEHFPVDASELAFDFRLTDDVNSEGRLATVAAMRLSDLNQLCDALKSCGLKAQGILPAAFGAWALARSLGERDAAVVQETADGWNVDVIHDRELRYSRVVPMVVGKEALPVEVSRACAAASIDASRVIAAGGMVLSGATTSEEGVMEALARPSSEQPGIHLEPSDAIAARINKRHQLRLRLSVCLLAVSLGCAYFIWSGRAADNADIKKLMAKDQKTLVTLQAAQKDLEGKVAAGNKVRDTLDRAFHPAQRFGDLAALAANAAPESSWLTAVTMERGKPVLIRGTALTGDAVYNFVGKLAVEPRLRDVKLAFVNNAKIEETPVVQFSVTGVAVGNLPIVEATKKGTSTEQ